MEANKRSSQNIAVGDQKQVNESSTGNYRGRCESGRGRGRG